MIAGSCRSDEGKSAISNQSQPSNASLGPSLSISASIVQATISTAARWMPPTAIAVREKRNLLRSKRLAATNNPVAMIDVIRTKAVRSGMAATH